MFHYSYVNVNLLLFLCVIMAMRFSFDYGNIISNVFSNLKPHFPNS
jgi:hypothetical protein